MKLTPNFRLPLVPPHLAQYEARFSAYETPLRVSGRVLTDSHGRTIAEGWDAHRFEKRNGKFITERRAAEVEAAIAEIARRVNAHDALVAALSDALDEARMSGRCVVPENAPAWCKAAELALAAATGE